MVAPMPRTCFDTSRAELAELLASEPAYRVDQVWQGLYNDYRPVQEITTLPAAMRARLADALPEALTEAARATSDAGDTVKLLWELHDGHHIETVLLCYRERTTVCISTQAGCAMGCGFCATGQAGFERHLSTGEIVEQVVRAQRVALQRDTPRRVDNVVFMGMGEPFANYDATWSAVERLHADLGRSARNLTISTVGLVPGIRRLTEERLPVNLAVSLHAANDELRNELVPINRRWPLQVLHDACATYVERSGRRLSFEWALIEDVNDRRSDARELAAIAVPLRAHVNLIPLNRTPGYPSTGTSAEGVRAFRDQLVSLGVNATIRANRGTDIDAACGQLRAAQPVKLRQAPRKDRRHNDTRP